MSLGCLGNCWVYARRTLGQLMKTAGSAVCTTRWWHNANIPPRVCALGNSRAGSPSCYMRLASIFNYGVTCWCQDPILPSFQGWLHPTISKSVWFPETVLDGQTLSQEGTRAMARLGTAQVVVVQTEPRFVSFLSSLLALQLPIGWDVWKGYQGCVRSVLTCVLCLCFICAFCKLIRFFWKSLSARMYPLIPAKKHRALGYLQTIYVCILFLCIVQQIVHSCS